jgi:outer membrane protein assembly factor BamA
MLRAMIIVLVCVAGGISQAAETDARLIDRLVFEGVHTFEAGDIRTALASRVDVVRAERPPVDRFGLLRAIERTVTLGYRHSGFQSATVNAALDEAADRVTVRVEEGPRHKCGTVKVAGGEGISAQALVEAVVSRTTEGDPLWQEGEPAPLDDLTRQKMRERVQQAFAREGFFSPRFDLQIETPPGQEVAALVIAVKNVGPRAQIGEIKVAGAKRDDQAAVILHLGLATGQPLDSRLPDRIGRSCSSPDAT